jgi:hypothetical protein
MEMNFFGHSLGEEEEEDDEFLTESSAGQFGKGI